MKSLVNPVNMLLCVALLSLSVFGGRLSQSQRAVPACPPLTQPGELDDPADRPHAPPKAAGQDERELPRLDDLFARPAVAPGAPADPGGVYWPKRTPSLSTRPPACDDALPTTNYDTACFAIYWRWGCFSSASTLCSLPQN